MVRDERPFASASFLSKLNNHEYTQATALLTEVIGIAEAAGIAYSELMGRKDTTGFGRIQLGLKKTQRIKGVDESGAILSEDADEGTPEQGQLQCPRLGLQQASGCS